MPFTFAHPLAILPLGIRENRYLDFTALIFGSMAPDFEYFIHFRPYQLHGHTLLGQLYYNLPLVLIISLIWHYIIKEQVILNLPAPYCTHYLYLTKKRWRIKSARSFVVFISSALIGMLTHLLWDSFTHIEGYFVTQIAILSYSISLMNYKIPLYKVLQHGSTLIGLIIIMVYLLRIQEKTLTDKIIGISKTSKLFFWIGIILIDFIILGAVVLLKEDFTAGRIIVSFISGGFIGTTIISMFVMAVNKVSR